MRYSLLGSLILSIILVGSAANARQLLQGNVSLSQEPAQYNRLQKAETRLNRVYVKLLNGLEGEGSQKLLESQHAWRQYSRAECDYLSNYSPVEPLHFVSTSECLTELTNERTVELQNHLEWLRLLQPGIAELRGL